MLELYKKTSISILYIYNLLPQHYFRKMGVTWMLVTIRDILYNTDVIRTSIVKLFVHRPVEKLV